MAQTETFTLENWTDVEQFIWLGNERKVIPPFSKRPFDEKTALTFLEACGRYVGIYRPAKLHGEPGEEKVWIANMTGTPFAPLKIQRQRKWRGDWIYEDVDNPMRVPRPLRYQMSIGQKVIDDPNTPGEHIALKQPRVPIELPIRARVLVGQSTAEFLFARDSYQEPALRGQIIPCREPSSFEPNDTWHLDDLRLYAALFHAQSFAPWIDPAKGTVKSEASYKNADEMELARVALLDVLFYRLVDERFPLVPEQEFKLRKSQLAQKKS